MFGLLRLSDIKGDQDSSVPNSADSFYRLGNENPSSARKFCHAAGEIEPNASDG